MGADMTRSNDKELIVTGAGSEEMADVIAFLASHDARFGDGVICPWMAG
jgi:hypothetical protein